MSSQSRRWGRVPAVGVPMSRRRIVTIAGFVEATQGKGRYQLSIRSEKQLIEGLNSIAGPLSRKRGEAGEYVLEGAW